MINHIKRAVIFVIGITIVLFGIALLALPGPGIVIIIAGLAVLAIEFIWARKMLKRVKHQAKRAGNSFRDFWR